MPPISPSSLSRPLFSLSPPSSSSTDPHGCERADPAATLPLTRRRRRRLSAIFLLSLSLAVDFLSPVQGSSVDPQIPYFASKFKVEAERKILEVREGQNNEMACENLSGKIDVNKQTKGSELRNMMTEDENAELSEKKIEEQQWPVMKEIEQKNATLLNEAEEKNASLSVNKFEVQDTTLMNKIEGKNAPLLNETEENNVHFLWLFCIFWRKRKKNRKKNRKKLKKNWAEPKFRFGFGFGKKPNR
ncbi:hypothetical protein DVH24_009125 [Malus domestica]|uniref:Uncharacterized protein n=1 Tax=Malus domestica TaxID=3750 RepID=A0A498JTW5_MALDO|nr:hypothetical protein DVH24_009125 [Malus domestica]